MGLHVIVIGSPFDGMRVVGIFKTGEEAHEWADRHVRHEDWWAIALTHPQTEERP